MMRRKIVTELSKEKEKNLDEIVLSSTASMGFLSAYEFLHKKDYSPEEVKGLVKWFCKCYKKDKDSFSELIFHLVNIGRGVEYYAAQELTKNRCWTFQVLI